MERSAPAQGSCLCGKVTLKTSELDADLHACHCSMCRQWSAGPFMSVTCGSNIEIDGLEYLGVFNSSEWAQRTFCKNCGTVLFYKLIDTQEHFVSAELFSDTDLNFKQQIFIDEKPHYYTFSNNTENLTGAQVFAQFSKTDH